MNHGTNCQKLTQFLAASAKSTKYIKTEKSSNPLPVNISFLVNWYFSAKKNMGKKHRMNFMYSVIGSDL